MERVNKKNKNANVKPFMVKNHLWIFINAQIENPAFDSQVWHSAACVELIPWKGDQLASLLLHHGGYIHTAHTHRLAGTGLIVQCRYYDIYVQPQHLLTVVLLLRSSRTPPQTKENLTLRASSFGSKCELPVPFLDKVAKCGLTDSILSFAEFRNNKELKKSDGAKRSRLTGETPLAAGAVGATALPCLGHVAHTAACWPAAAR